ncbi:hypothetical protein U2E19_14985 [Acinetobacter baumannii]|uniref:hypothetical protein n=1 Tax=Acinetobacter baumannii TaxID=470 RepID=UPI0033902732
MTDLNKERELYESVIEKTQGIKIEHLVGISFNAESNQYEISGEKWACELTDACEELNTGWFIWQECVKAKAQAVPDTHVVVPKELNTEIALNMARDRILKQPLGKDPVWNELVEQAYKDNLQAEKCRLIRDYREMIKASESGAEG